ncbi:hypothetical protein RT99_08085 [Flavobacterium sp. MEB061]|nr:hypothetical protein RT99_08085 [Flavobacterium sp. MEB061]
MATNTGGWTNYSTVSGNMNMGNYSTEYWIKSNGVLLQPIKEVGDFLIFDKIPTAYYFSGYRPESYSCSGSCGEEWSSGLSATNFNINCYNAVGYGIGYSIEIIPYFNIISNQVLVSPGADNNFCDKISLKTVGCTGPQKFYWEYRIDGGSFQKTNISTNYNQAFEFIKLNYLPAAYSGNIDFKAVIDSDPSINGEEVDSNIISFNIIPCSPDLVGVPELKKTTCIYKNDGKATFTFSRDIANNEHFLFNVYQKSNGQLIKSPTVLQADFPDRKYTFTDLPKGTYYLVYQTFIGTQQTSVNLPPYPEFTIGSESPIDYKIFDNQPFCNNEKGQIRLEVSGGTEPYYYILNSDVEVQFTSPINITVTSGDYSIKVRDKYNCIDTKAND